MSFPGMSSHSARSQTQSSMSRRPLIDGKIAGGGYRLVDSENESVSLLQIPENHRDHNRSNTTRESHDVGIRMRNRNLISKRHHIRRSFYNDRSSIELNNNSGGNVVSTQPTCNGCCCVQCIRTNEVAIVSKCGEFHEIRSPGLSLFCWPLIGVEKRISLRVHQLDLVAETKTKDNVFVTVRLAVLFKVENPHKAYYTLSNPSTQIQMLVYDKIRSTVPSLDIDNLFRSSQDMSLDILRSLQFFVHENYGYDIINVLITSIYPSDANVVHAMNEINACKRMKEAMMHKGEAEKITRIKNAEANSEALYLSGIGIANERKAIANGIKETMLGRSNDDEEMIPGSDVMDLLLLTQYYDMLDAVGKDNSKTSNMILEYDANISEFSM